MKKFFIAAIAVTLMIGASCSRQESMEALAKRVFDRAQTQFALLDRSIDSVRTDGAAFLYPRTLSSEGELVTSDRWWWCSGFYPGSLWLAYEYSGNEEMKNLAVKYTLPLDTLRHRKDDHDIGFQIMCSFGNAFRITGEEVYRGDIADGAGSLATRFNRNIGCTRSWNWKWTFPVIIDNMMNLELLLKGAELTGCDSLRQIALTHARTTMKNHYRADHSCFHLVDYSPETGEVIGKQTVQGFADSSAWSRGQAWGLYGYTMVYRYTKEQDMLDQATDIAEYLLPRLPEDGIPYWDYDSDLIPDDLRDASAAAIMASALVELSKYVSGDKSGKYLKTAEKILRTLASDEYLAAPGELHGFLLRHSTGNKPGKSEMDVPLTYADYYFLEALLRYVGRK